MNRLRLAVALLPIAGLAACAAFSTTPEPAVVASVHQAVTPGMSVEAAHGALADLGFSCTPRRGAYTDEAGKAHEDQHFLECTRRPGMVSVACANRDQVVVVPDSGGPVTAVEVSRGPHCANQ